MVVVLLMVRVVMVAGGMLMLLLLGRRVITIAIRSGQDASASIVAGVTVAAAATAAGAIGSDRINSAALMVHHLRITTVETISVQCHVAVGCAVAKVGAVTVQRGGGAIAVAISAAGCWMVRTIENHKCFYR